MDTENTNINLPSTPLLEIKKPLSSGLSKLRAPTKLIIDDCNYENIVNNNSNESIKPSILMSSKTNVLGEKSLNSTNELKKRKSDLSDSSSATPTSNTKGTFSFTNKPNNTGIPCKITRGVTPAVPAKAVLKVITPPAPVVKSIIKPVAKTMAPPPIKKVLTAPIPLSKIRQERTVAIKSASSTPRVSAANTPRNVVVEVSTPRAEEYVDEEMQNKIKELENKLTQTFKSLDVLKNSEITLNEIIDEKTASIRKNEKEIRRINENIQELNSELETVQSENKIKIAKLTREKTSLQSDLESTQLELEQSRKRNVELEAMVKINNSSIAQLKDDVFKLEAEITQLKSDYSNLQLVLSEHKATISNHEATINRLESKVRTDEELRKKLHNTIQELKGNIRVFCRFRPALEESKESTEDSVQFICVPDTDQKELSVLAAPNKSADGLKTQQKKWGFEFDRVFDGNASQKVVFDEIGQLVQSALDGYKVNIMAYGQTGSGKTHTMEGPTTNPNDESRGMIPRAVEQIFLHCEMLKEKGWSFTIDAMFLEIYNENIVDLLSDTNVEDEKHAISHNNNITSVSNVNIVPVKDSESVYPLLVQASKKRSVARTNCNERSSRSHSIFQLKISGSNSITSLTSTGFLNLIDLAGSERVSKSGASGARLEETKNINKSLSCLGDVIAALAEKNKHIPFRNSTLTYLLQQCFDKDSKTLMFINLAPEADNLQESLCTLRFGAKANSAEIGTARKNIKEVPTPKNSTNSTSSN